MCHIHHIIRIFTEFRLIYLLMYVLVGYKSTYLSPLTHDKHYMQEKNIFPKYIKLLVGLIVRAPCQKVKQSP